ncbi:MAG: polymerase [Herbaspirillum sp.]|nr:polymerase [Herbaspirillum sp.]
MPLWIALHLPLLSLEVFRLRWSAEALAIVFEQERVVALSASARALGVEPGMRRAGALLLAADAMHHERDRQREAQTLHDAAMALLQYSPMLAAAEEDTLLIDISASLRLFGGIRRLCRRIRHTAGRLGLSVRLGCAPTAQAAWLLARDHGKSGRGARALTMPTLTRLIDRLRPDLLPAARAHNEWLQGIGCRSLGQLRRLPRNGLQRRCGQPLLKALDCAYGRAPELFDWIVAPPAFDARIELPDRIEQAQALLHATQRLLVQMIGWLSAGQLAVRQIVLQLEHERGRQAIAPTPVHILLAEASWHEEHLLRLLRERLARIELTAPVIAISLAASQVEAMAIPSQTLFPEPGGNKEDHQRLIELLTARLGADAVLQAAPQADHRPDAANAWAPVLHAAAAAPLPAGLPRPTWLLRQAIALTLREHRPFYGSVLKMVSPPERIEAGWWNGAAVTRDYFIAEGRDHAHYWIYRERLGGQAQAHWYLQGLFG